MPKSTLTISEALDKYVIHVDVQRVELPDRGMAIIGMVDDLIEEYRDCGAELQPTVCFFDIPRQRFYMKHLVRHAFFQTLGYHAYRYGEMRLHPSRIKKCVEDGRLIIWDVIAARLQDPDELAEIAAILAFEAQRDTELAALGVTS